MIIIIDNYDSFTFNLYQAFAVLEQEVKVVRNDILTVEELANLEPTHVVISPGPGTPEKAGISIAAIRHFSGKVPVLGVCLGHQAIAAAYGGNVKRASRLMHGKVSVLTHDNKGIFEGLPQQIKVMRYHSLITDEEALPQELVITARTLEGELMAVKHKEFTVFGVQFHPEAYLTEYGSKIFENFVAVK